MRITLLAALLVLPALAGCTGDGGASADRVVIETDMGDIVIDLAADEAPKTVENFLKYVDDGFYDNTLFHRIIEDFMIQGGGMDTDGQFKQPTHPPVENEAASSGLKNTKYSIAMARTTDPDSATNQFFINHADNTFLDPSGSGAGYAVFGHVVEGQDVVDAIAAVPVEAYQGRPDQHCQSDSQPSCPVDDVVIQTIRRAGGGEGPSGDADAQDDPATPADVHADLITPGTWNVTHADESILAWADNRGGTGADVAWSLTGPDGGGLPEGWSVTFDEAEQTVGADGGSAQTVHTMVRLTVPDDAAGDHDLELHTGHSTTPIVASVDLVHDRISQEGDSVTTSYRGTCTQNGQEFDSGEFPLTLGGGRAIVGFDLGLVGLGLNEPATIVIPAALAYGDTQGPCAGLDPADLTFEVEILSFDE